MYFYFDKRFEFSMKIIYKNVYLCHMHDYQLIEFISGLLIILEINPINQTIILVDKVNKFNASKKETTAMFK